MCLSKIQVYTGFLRDKWFAYVGGGGEERGSFLHTTRLPVRFFLVKFKNYGMVSGAPSLWAGLWSLNFCIFLYFLAAWCFFFRRYGYFIPFKSIVLRWYPVCWLTQFCPCVGLLLLHNWACPLVRIRA